MDLSFPTLMGVVGSAFVILAYLLIAVDRLTNTSLAFYVINLLGNVLLLYSLYYHPNTGSIVIEFFCIGISLVGIYRNQKSRKQAQCLPDES